MLNGGGKILSELFRVWGLDGSGEHSNYHQLTKVSYTTKQVMSVCFDMREVTVSDAGGARVS